MEEINYKIRFVFGTFPVHGSPTPHWAGDSSSEFVQSGTPSQRYRFPMQCRALLGQRKNPVPQVGKSTNYWIFINDMKDR